jgi:hypothetical protein
LGCAFGSRILLIDLVRKRKGTTTGNADFRGLRCGLLFELAWQRENCSE